MRRKCLLLVMLLVVWSVSSSAQGQLAHHWALDEIVWSNGSIVDRITGQLCSVFGSTPGPDMGLPAPAGYGTAIDLTEPGAGIWGIVTIPNAIPSTGDFTIRALIKTTQTAGEGHIFSNNNSQAGRMNLMISGGYLAVFYGGSPANFILAPQTPNAFVADGRWHFVELSRRGNLFELLVDGFVVGTHLAAGATVSTSGTNVEWMIGRARGFFGDYDGLVADLKVYHQDYSFVTDRAWDPSPALGATGVSVDTDMMLEWKTAMHPYDETATRSDVTAYYLYFNTEPNFADIAPITIAADSPPAASASFPKAVEMDKTYYWRVDQSVSGSQPDDPNTIVGAVWSFETLKTVPVITSAPSDILLDAAGDKAVFSVGVDSFSPVMFQLYRSSDMTPSFDEVTGLPLDTPVGDAVGPLFPPDVIGTLEIGNVQFNDEGFYYVQVWNSAGLGQAVYTDVVRLGIKRLMAHWTLDADKFVGDQYLDETGSYPADPNDPALAAGSFVEGVIGDAVAVNSGSFANAGTWRPNAVTGQMTVSAWVKVTGTVTGDSQGIVSKRDADGLDWSLYVRGGDGSHPGGNYVRFSSHANGDVWAGPNAFTANEWVYVTAVVDGDNAGRVYINGLQAAVDSAWGWGPNPNAPMMLGAGSPTLLTLPGQLDDVKIYNYALDAEAIAQSYVNVTGVPMCFYGRPALDVSGPDGLPDCVVDLYDFAELAAQWLESGLMHPQP